MRVLLAGATGVLGRHIARALIAAGHQVIGLGRGSGGTRPLSELGADYLRGDLMDRENLLEAVGGMTADAVIHAATALRKPPMRYRDMTGTNALRTQGTANLGAAAQLVGARRMISESMHVGYGFGDWGDRVITEEDTPFAPRGNSAALEAIMAGFRAKERHTFHTDGIEGIALRFGFLYGPGFGVGGTDVFVAMLRKRRLPVTAGGGLVHWTHLRDAGAATVAALEQGRPGHAYNIVDDEPTAMSDHIRMVAEAFGTPTPMRVPMGLVRLAAPYVHTMMNTSMRVSNAKAEHELGWRPSMPSSRDGIQALAGDR